MFKVTPAFIFWYCDFIRERNLIAFCTHVEIFQTFKTKLCFYFALKNLSNAWEQPHVAHVLCQITSPVSLISALTTRSVICNGCPEHSYSLLQCARMNTHTLLYLLLRLWNWTAKMMWSLFLRSTSGAGSGQPWRRPLALLVTSAQDLQRLSPY